MCRKTVACAALGLVLVLAAAAWAKYAVGPKIPPDVQAKFKRYDSKYYVVFSDLAAEQVEAAVTRVTAVAEDYYQLTKPLGRGAITSKWPLYIVSNRKDYTAAGGEAFGCTWADRLMALIDDSSKDEIWHVLQHEMLHQFMHTVVSEDTPGWVDEGMAEYYGESVWTGDGLMPGNFPKKRFDRFLPRVKEGRLRPFKDIILIQATKWPGGIEDYDQAMTMVNFFLNGAKGKYQKGFYNYLKSTTAGKAPWDAAFATCFGKNIDAITKEYTDWVTNELQAESDRAYAKGTAATLASYLGRAWSQKQTFATFDEFLAAAKDGSLKKQPKQPLPDELLKEALGRAEKLKTWSLDVPKTGLPKIVLAEEDGTTITAGFALKNGQVESTKVELKEKKP